MANRAARVTVGTTAVRLTGDDDFRLDQTVLIRPRGGDICVGGADVTTTTGFLVTDGEAFDDNTDSPVYGIAAAPVTVHVYRGGVA